MTGFALNLFLYPAVLAGLTILQSHVAPYTLIGVIAFLTLSSVAVWLRTGSFPSPGDVRRTSSQLLLSAGCLLVVVVTHPREVLAPIGDYMMIDSLREVVDALPENDRDQIRHAEARVSPNELIWTYDNLSTGTRAIVIAFLADCPSGQMVTKSIRDFASRERREEPVAVSALRVPSSRYANAIGSNADIEFPHRIRLFLSEAVELAPGRNEIAVACQGESSPLRAVDLSMMDHREALESLYGNLVLRSEPEVGDAQEAFLASKYALTRITWVNPPLLYPIYRSVFEILGPRIRSISLFGSSRSRSCLSRCAPSFVKGTIACR